MSNTWVLVADSSCAKIFETHGIDDTLHEITDLVHVESRLHEQKVTSDLPGTNAGEGGSRHGFEAETGIKEYEAIEFAREINAKLEEGLNKAKFDNLILAAPPAFLGVLRKNINPNLAKLISTEVNKDLVKFSTSEIIEHLAAKV